MYSRTSTALALAALLAVPAVASAQAKKAPTRTQTTRPAAAGATGTGALTIGGFAGLEAGALTGFALRADGEMPFQQLAPQVKLSFVGSLGYTRFGKSIPYGDIDYNIVKLIPAARFTMPVNPQLDLYGDAGIGLYYWSFSSKQNLPFLGTQKLSDSGLSVMMRLGAGGFYKVNPKVKIGAEFGVLPYFGEVGDTNVSIMAGAMFLL